MSHHQYSNPNNNATLCVPNEGTTRPCSVDPLAEATQKLSLNETRPVTALQGGSLFQLANKQEVIYRKARIVDYLLEFEDHCDSLLLSYENQDKEFSHNLLATPSLRSVFIAVTCGNEVPKDAVASRIYIEHMLLARCRFACVQKFRLSLYIDNIRDDDTKKQVIREVDDELRYIHDLLENFCSAPSLKQNRQIVQDWMLDDLVEKEEGTMSSEDTEEMSVNSY